MTGATNILALEGLETADVVQALERHSSRHGIPAVILNLNLRAMRREDELSAELGRSVIH